MVAYGRHGKDSRLCDTGRENARSGSEVVAVVLRIWRVWVGVVWGNSSSWPETDDAGASCGGARQINVVWARNTTQDNAEGRGIDQEMQLQDAENPSKVKEEKGKQGTLA